MVLLLGTGARTHADALILRQEHNTVIIGFVGVTAQAIIPFVCAGNENVG